MQVMEEKKFRMVVFRIARSEGENTEYAVLSLNSTAGKPKQYTVKRNSYKWLCSCFDFQRHASELNYVCKHIEAIFLAITRMGWNRDAVEVEVVRRYRRGRKQNTQCCDGHLESIRREIGVTMDLDGSERECNGVSI
jgi:hypothetical protein